MKAWDSSGACSSAISNQTGTSSPAIAEGPRRIATRLDFPVGDTVDAKVDVGTGNLLLTTTDLTLRGVDGDVALGGVYDSLQMGTGSRFLSGALGYGWRYRTGADVKLVTNPDGSVSYFGQNALTGRVAAGEAAGSAVDE